MKFKNAEQLFDRGKSQQRMRRLSMLILGTYFLFSLIWIPQGAAQISEPSQLPDSVYSGGQGKFHVQGVAVDQKQGFLYFSFTDKLVKTDLTGKMIGSVTGFVGHLGDLVFDPENGKIFASLEFKDDEIGQGISSKLGVDLRNQVGFYVAIFDGAKITRPGMDAEEEEVLRTVYVKEAVQDYLAVVNDNGREVQHRFACSGIDGITLAPAIGGKAGSKKYLYVAYGIYGDTTRSDNDHQIILQFDPADWDQLGRHLSQEDLHRSGPEQPREKYFLKTGNTTYGIQNLAFDEYSGYFYAAVYRGRKPEFPNYGIFVIDGHKTPRREKITSDGKKVRVKTLSLLDEGPEDPRTGIRGWHFYRGATGLCPLGEGFFYISHNRRSETGLEETTIHKYKWIGDEKTAFQRIDRSVR